MLHPRRWAGLLRALILGAAAWACTYTAGLIVTRAAFADGADDAKKASPAVGSGPATSTDDVPSAEKLGLKEKKVDVHEFRVVDRFSGSVSYYRFIEDPAESFIRATYRPPLETVTLGYEVPENLRQSTKRLRWKWRAQVFPKNGNECKSGFGDSAAVIYVSWKRGLKWYSLKYVWSPVGPKGETCDQKRNLFVVQDTVISRSGGPTGQWVTEDIDPSAEFRKHFENNDPKAEVPDFVGVGLMSDGDDTKSVSAADYGGFSLLY